MYGMSPELARPKTVNKIHDRNNSEVSESTTTPVPPSPSSHNSLPETEVSTLIVSHPEEASLESVSANNISPETKIPSTPQISIQTHDRAYFRNKLLEQYPNLYKEY
ncbi:20275_t:CDS:2, partial [Dentiscutata erythropus]